jgi:hypothetical protein
MEQHIDPRAPLTAYREEGKRNGELYARQMRDFVRENFADAPPVPDLSARVKEDIEGTADDLRAAGVPPAKVQAYVQAWWRALRRALARSEATPKDAGEAVA